VRRSGIIGIGFIGAVHARAVRASGGVVSAVAGSSLESAELAASRLGEGVAARSAAQLIAADDVDIVHICTPNYLHGPLASQVIAAGKHVICEKPLATEVRAADELTQAADVAGVLAVVPFVYRFYPTVRDARARTRRGDTGPLHLLHGSYLQDWLSSSSDDNWRVDPVLGGPSRAFADIGIHWVDLVEFVSGHRLTRVLARTVTAYPERTTSAGTTVVRTEDAAVVIFETDNGAIGSVVTSQVTPGRKNRLWFSLDGSAQSMSFDQELPDSLWVGTTSETRVVPRGSPDSTPESRAWDILPPGHPQGYQDAFTAFITDVYATLDGRAPDGLPRFADGARATRLTAAVLESAAYGEWRQVA
jgi:predicted dehydrogenase